MVKRSSGRVNATAHGAERVRGAGPADGASDRAGWRSNLATQQGLDLQGGLQVLLEARPPAGQTVDASVLNGTKDTIGRRVNGLGVREPVIQTHGSNQILVELPGVQDPEQA